MIQFVKISQKKIVRNITKYNFILDKNIKKNVDSNQLIAYTSRFLILAEVIISQLLKL